jgi:hypothetical protein
MANAHEAGDLLTPGPAIDGVPNNEIDTGSLKFTDSDLGLPEGNRTGETYKPEEYKDDQGRDFEPKPKEGETAKTPADPMDILKAKGLGRFKSVDDALDAYVNLNSKIGEMATKLEQFGQVQERNRILEEQLEKIFEIDGEGNLVLTETARKQYVKEQKEEHPEKTKEDILEDLDRDFDGTLDKLVESKLKSKLKDVESFISKQKAAEQARITEQKKQEEADNLFNHYMDNVEGFKENIDKIEKILVDNPELYELKDPLKAAMNLLKKVEEFATQKKNADAFVETSRTQPEQTKTEEEADWDNIILQHGTNAASLLER